MHQITIEQATANIASVFADVQHGEEIVITDREKPFAKVIPFVSSKGKKRVFGGGKGIFTFVSDDFDEPLEDFKDYM
jgi:antitoxin (DNA-binding transcriptional repressor) of toxin-antitoxin stability system